MLGDRVASALDRLGITPERVERWVGAPCDCEERRQKLNRLHVWATRILRGKLDKAIQYLDSLLEEE